MRYSPVNIQFSADMPALPISASAKCPKQYTMERDKMVRYFPSSQSAKNAPRIGVRYTQKVKSWYRAIASVFDIGVPAVSESKKRYLVMKIVRIPFIP